MNKSTFALAGLIGLGSAHISLAASPATPGLSTPGLSSPTPRTQVATATPTLLASSAVSAGATGPALAVASSASGTAVASVAPTPAPTQQPGMRPTLGQWQDLAERQAFNDQSAKVNGSNNQPVQQQVSTPQAALHALSLDDAPKKPRRASDSCGDGNSACFYAVYGMHVDGGEDNYHGLLAIDGLIETVYKGKTFATAHDHYTLKRISTRELVYADSHGRPHTIPFSGEADEEADPADLKAVQKPTVGQPMMPSFPQR